MHRIGGMWRTCYSAFCWPWRRWRGPSPKHRPSRSGRQARRCRPRARSWRPRRCAAGSMWPGASRSSARRRPSRPTIQPKAAGRSCRTCPRPCITPPLRPRAIASTSRAATPTWGSARCRATLSPTTPRQGPGPRLPTCRHRARRTRWRPLRASSTSLAASGRARKTSGSTIRRPTDGTACALRYPQDASISRWRCSTTGSWSSAAAGATPAIWRRSRPTIRLPAAGRAAPTCRRPAAG